MGLFNITFFSRCRSRSTFQQHISHVKNKLFHGMPNLQNVKQSKELFSACNEDWRTQINLWNNSKMTIINDIQHYSRNRRWGSWHSWHVLSAGCCDCHVIVPCTPSRLWRWWWVHTADFFIDFEWDDFICWWNELWIERVASILFLPSKEILAAVLLGGSSPYIEAAVLLQWSQVWLPECNQCNLLFFFLFLPLDSCLIQSEP